jgi:subtilisin family serine protease
LDVALFDGTIRQLDGTSFSAPAVAGIAAQVLSQNPDITTRDLIAKLIQRARTQGATAGGVPVLP